MKKKIQLKKAFKAFLKLKTKPLMISLLFIFFYSQAHSNEQKKRITLEVDNTPIEEVLNIIEIKTGLRFLYSVEQINTNRKVSISAVDEPIDTVLEKIFKKTNVTYVFYKRQIILKTKTESTSKTNKTFDKTQQVEVSGTVIDKYNAPLAGVSILIINTQKGTYSDFDGSFKISANIGDQLIFSYLGFSDSVITVESENIDNVKVMLYESSIELNEVEIVSSGYQDLYKERATGAFEKIKEETLDLKINQNVLNKIEAEIPGINRETRNGNLVVRGLSTFGTNNGALIVLDGVPLEGDFSTINPNDIKSITVLKDAAAAAIWGIASGNGVIIIESKKARKKEISIDVSSNLAYTQERDLFNNNYGDSQTQLDFQSALLNRTGFRSFNTDNLFSGNLEQQSITQLSPVLETLLLQQRGDITADEANVRLQQLSATDVRNEYKELFLRPTTWQQYNFALNAGGETSTVRASLTHNKNEEEIIGNDSGQIIANLSTTFDFTNRLKVTASINYSQTKAKLLPGAPFDGFTGGLNPPITPRSFLSSIPFNSRILDDNNNYIPMVRGANAQSSQLAQELGFLYPWTFNLKQELDNSNRVVKDLALRLQAGLEYEFAKSFKAQLKYQYEWSQNEFRGLYNENTFTVRNRVNAFTQTDFLTTTPTDFPLPEGSIFDIQSTNSRSFTVRSQIDYNKLIGDHELVGLVGYEVRRTFIDGLINDRKFGYNDQTLTNANVNGNTFFNLRLQPSVTFPRSQFIPNINTSQSPEGLQQENRFFSYFGNLSYTYLNKYVLSGSIRFDDTNLFGASDKTRNIPLYSFGAKWNIHREGFLHNTFVNLLALRATYGINANVNRDAIPFTLAQVERDFFTGNNFARITSLPNPDLRLERVKSFNLGLDFGLFNGKVNGSVEYYNRLTVDALTSADINATLGTTSFLLNFGSISNKGVDIQLGVNVVDNGTFAYTTNTVFSHNVNRIKKSGITPSFPSIFTGGGALEVGSPIRTLYSYNYAGLDRDGRPQFIDDDNNIADYTTPIQDVSALVQEGVLEPRFFGSWINNIKYKSFYLRLLTSFEAGHVFRFNSPENHYIQGSLPYVNVPADFNNRWQQQGDENHTDVPAFIVDSFDTFQPGYQQYSQSDRFVDTATSIRLRQINFGYDFPRAVNNALKIRSFRVGLQVDNAAVWTFNKWNIDPRNPVFPLLPTYTLNISASF